MCGFRTDGRMDAMVGGWMMMDGQTGGRVGVWIKDGRMDASERLITPNLDVITPKRFPPI